MKVVSVINYKGGVGKTTLTANLAAYLACLGKRVLLLDMDAQCSLTTSFMPVKDWQKLSDGGKTLKGWFSAIQNPGGNSDLKPLIANDFAAARSVQNAGGGSISLLPSDLDLLDVDLELARLLYSHKAEDIPRRFVDLHGKLREQLRAPGFAETFDAALLDCPPNFNIVTKTAIIASDDIVIPTVPDDMSMVGIPHLIRRRGRLADEFNGHCRSIGLPEAPRPKIKAVVPMIWKATSAGSGGPSKAHHDKFVNSLRPRLREPEDVIKQDGISFPKGFRHLASFVAGTGMIPAVMSPPECAGDVDRQHAPIWRTFADTVQGVGEHLGWSAPDKVRVSQHWRSLSQFNPKYRRGHNWRYSFPRRLCKLLREGSAG